jgi:alkanesulfonate monooxygenase SsuD/methylene tetrahydromethanopterin reductase-like flavin-dependent oxidoreductase (luciferase family)
MVEYATIVLLLLRSHRAVSHDGRFYSVQNLLLYPALEPALNLGVFVAGASEQAQAAAEKLGAVLIEYPEPPTKPE